MHITTLFTIFISTLTTIVSAGANPFTLNSTTLNAGFTAGTPVVITWDPTSSGTVTLLLKQGVSTNLGDVATIVANTANDGSFTWTPSTSLVQGSDYALEIVDDDNTNSVNYSSEFTINSSVTASASTQSTTATSTASSSSSSSSSNVSSSASTSASTTVSSTTITSTSSSATSATSATTKSSSTTLATTTTSSSTATDASASSTSTVVSGGAIKLKFGGGMLALVGGVMLAL